MTSLITNTSVTTTASKENATGNVIAAIDFLKHLTTHKCRKTVTSI